MEQAVLEMKYDAKKAPLGMTYLVILTFCIKHRLFGLDFKGRVLK